MIKIALILSLGVLSLLVGSCSSGEDIASNPDGASETQPAETPEASTSEAETEVAEVEATFAPRTEGTQVSGLIPPTNPRQHRAAIAKGRPDPFGLVPLKPTIEVIKAQESSQAVQSSPIATAPVASSPKKPSQPKTIKPLPSKPEPPKATLAEEVIISGIVDVGGLPQIILQAPGEKFSRYIQPGQYVSNGQVLVKRIKEEFGKAPVVVLEQNGIEVYKALGEKVEKAAAEKPKETAS